IRVGEDADDSARFDLRQSGERSGKQPVIVSEEAVDPCQPLLFRASFQLGELPAIECEEAAGKRANQQPVLVGEQSRDGLWLAIRPAIAGETVAVKSDQSPGVRANEKFVVETGEAHQ